jgi:CheY-like chemotaxis protein
LAEDNLVNQRVAVRLLEKRGHQVTVVHTGREAVQAALAQSFDAILMDVQMPELDGFEATAAIREAERATGRQVHIVAMTAHAMKGDRERCLAAGMNDYVSKPLQADALFAAVERCGPSTAALPPETTESPQLPPLDLAALREHFGDDDLLKDVGEALLDSCPAWSSDIRAAIDSQNAANLKFTAHTIKGAVSHFGDQHAYNAARRLEQLAQDGDLTNAEPAIAALDRALDRLQAALRQICKPP